jgi:hypothetical protein
LFERVGFNSLRKNHLCDRLTSWASFRIQEKQRTTPAAPGLTTRVDRSTYVVLNDIIQLRHTSIIHELSKDLSRYRAGSTLDVFKTAIPPRNFQPDSGNGPDIKVRRCAGVLVYLDSKTKEKLGPIIGAAGLYPRIDQIIDGLKLARRGIRNRFNLRKCGN